MAIFQVYKVCGDVIKHDETSSIRNNGLASSVAILKNLSNYLYSNFLN